MAQVPEKITERQSDFSLREWPRVEFAKISVIGVEPFPHHASRFNRERGGRFSSPMFV